MKKHNVTEYFSKKQKFGDYKIYKVYYVGNNKKDLRMRAIYKNLTYQKAEEILYKLESTLKIK